MQQALRPYVTTGVAIVGAAVITVVPAAPQLLDSPLPHVRQHAVRLTATDPFTPYAELFTNTADNLQALGAHAFEFPVLAQFLADPGGSIAHIPDVLALLTNMVPSIDVTAVPLPAHISIELPPLLSQLLAGLGPLVTLSNAIQDIGGQISGGDALAAIIGAPATLLNALLNGTDGVDVMGTNIPLFNGLLAPGQSFDVTMDVGQLVNSLGLGDQTISDLLGDFGNTTIQSLLTELLDTTGVGQLTPVGLLDEMGFGQEHVGTLLVDLLNSAGMGEQSLADLADQFGFGGDTTVASLIVGLLDSSDIGNPTITELLGQFGYGDATLGSLIKDMLDPTGMGSAPLTSFIDPDISLGSLLNDMLGGTTFTGMLEQLGVGDMTLPELTAMLLGDYGDQTLLELIGLGFLGPVDPNDSLIAVFQAMMPPGYTLESLLNDGDTPVGDMTLGDLISLAPNPNGPGTMADMPFTALLSLAGIGDQTLCDLDGGPGVCDPQTDKIGNPTLNQIMGTNSVEQTLQNLKLWDVNLNQIVAALGPTVPDGHPGLETVEITQLLGMLTGAPSYQEVSLGGFLTSIGFNPDLNTILARFMDGLGIGDQSLVQLFSAWGLDNLQMSNVIDSLGLNNVNILSVMNALGLNNLDLDTVIDRLGLSNITLVSLLNNLGLNTVHLDQVVNSLFGNMTMGPILDGLGLNDVTLGGLVTNLMDSILGNPTLSSMLTALGLDTNTLDTVVTELMAGLGLTDTTVNSLLGDLGVDNVELNTLLDGLGLSDVDAVNVNSTYDFFGAFGEQLINLPQQIAAALAGG